jgi:hypothetical protein
MRPVVLALAVIATPAAAHHSVSGLYETSRSVRIEGKLILVAIENPHSRFEIESDKGEIWKVESRGVAGMSQRRFDASAYRIGDRVKVEGSPARDGSRSLWLRRLTPARGRAFDASARSR